uniref:Helicase HerA barrel domain-containing protein n=1 Tax=Thermorudis peleae TaxID=1382356 RepID=A0A831T9T5_9BACT
MSEQPESLRLGEVIETSTVGFVAECDELHCLPPLGSLVSVNGPEGDVIYAVVTYGETGSIDPGRRVVRRGSADLRDQAIYQQNPELRHVLRSVFSAAAIAYRRDDRLSYLLPPLPPPLHYSVERVPTTEAREVTDQPRYFPILAQYRGEIPADQLLAAHARHLYELRGHDRDWLERAARELARIFKHDYDRLVPLLEALDPDLA